MDGSGGGNMESSWVIGYLVLAALAIVQSLLLTLQTWEHRRYARGRTSKPDRHQPTGRAVVFAPCKGLDIDLEENLRALLRQDYHDYEVTFVTQSEEDPACRVIRRVMAEHPGVVTRLLIAGRAAESGQKVHNLRTATAGVGPPVEYLAFVDSDARPGPEWLRLLIARLYRPGLGAVTGYRWFVPTRPSLANHLLYSLNCNVMSLFSRNNHCLLWGGSWAVGGSVRAALRGGLPAGCKLAAHVLVCPPAILPGSVLRCPLVDVCRPGNHLFEPGVAADPGCVGLRTRLG